jgi:hypothetical protein
VASSLSETDDETIQYQVTENGWYTWRIFGVDGAANTYTMRYNEDPSTCQDDGYEPNDEMAEATSLDLDPFMWPEPNVFADLQICGYDDDWFVVTFYADETALVDLDFVHADGDIDLLFYDAEHHLLAWDMGTQDGAHIEYDIPVQGDYYILVSAMGEDNPYDLLVNWSY